MLHFCTFTLKRALKRVKMEQGNDAQIERLCHFDFAGAGKRAKLTSHWAVRHCTPEIKSGFGLSLLLVSRR